MKPGAGGQAESSDREVLAGLVERVTFHNPENGFCVLRTKARGHRDLVTVVGHLVVEPASSPVLVRSKPDKTCFCALKSPKGAESDDQADLI